VEVLTQFGVLPAVAAVLYGLAAFIWSVDRLTQDVLTFRLVRRALKKKKAQKVLGDLAKIIEAQQGKRRRWRRQKNEPPKSLPSS
jgi:hypothetical protein